MANLLFKKGSYENFVNNVLNGNKAVEGTLYFTEDEGGLYVGQAGGVAKRIQGSILYFESLQEFTNEVKPPYSSEVIYFIANNNALVRWRKDSSLEHGGEWKILNFTHDDGAALIGRVDELQGQLTGLNQTLTNDYTLKSEFDLVAGRLTDAEDDIDNAQRDIISIQSDITNRIDKDISGIRTDISGINSQLSGFASKEYVDGEVSDINILIGAINQQVEKHEGSISEIAETIGDSSKAESILGQISAIQKTLGTVTGGLSGCVSQENFNKIVGSENQLKEYLKDDNKTIVGDIDKLSTDIGDVNVEGSIKYNINDIYNIIGSVGDTTDNTIRGNINNLTIQVSDNRALVLAKADKTLIGTEDEIKDYADNGKTVIENISNLQTSVNDIINTDIGDTETEGSIRYDINDIYNIIGTVEEPADNTIRGNIKQLTTTVNEHSGMVSTLATIKADKTLIGTEDEIKDYTKNNKTVIGDISSLQASVNTINNAIGSVEDTTNDTIRGSINNINTTISSHGTDIDSLKSVDAGLQQQITALGTNLDNRIKAANALSYKGILTGSSPLPTSNVSIGDTYVVGEGYQLPEGSKFDFILSPGDLLIAYGEEVTDANGNNTGFINNDNISWHHVDIGYNEAFEPTLSVSNNSVRLDNPAGKEIGAFEITGSENVVISTSGNAINVGMVWGSF